MFHSCRLPQSLIQILNKVIDVLETDGESYRTRSIRQRSAYGTPPLLTITPPYPESRSRYCSEISIKSSIRASGGHKILPDALHTK
ncbi:MAG: hypothetical protein A2V87_06765 [Deltaproteobacteria bacterium RBG_16_58_17]|nr:MAG: hypothetical protein A2V87_06765 [Deltaproteobacteria bacterium RBG_16_58_17]OHE17729.1 MAG: hypothetical protein A2X96_04465 [Syntrophobacterales bacterium GWC2_56_13]